MTFFLVRSFLALVGWMLVASIALPVFGVACAVVFVAWVVTGIIDLFFD